MENFWQDRRVVVTGGHGFLGTHLLNYLAGEGAYLFAPDSHSHNLLDREKARSLYGFFHRDERKKPVVFHLAARVSGIGAIGKRPAASLHDNLIMGLNVLQAAADSRFDGAVVMVGSVCAYPKNTPQPMLERNLWEGYPEETNGPYGVAKRTLSLAAELYKAEYNLPVYAPLLGNLYGPGDDYDPETSHVIPALIRKMIEARERDEPSVTVWGTGNASRDFLYVHDAVEALAMMVENLAYPQLINIGTGKEVTISALAELVKRTVGYRGTLVYDRNKPDGQPRRCLQTREAHISMKWDAKTTLEKGILETYKWLEPILKAEYREENAARTDENAALRKLGFNV